MTSILEVEQLDTLSSNASSTITIGGTNTTTIAFGPNVTTTPSSLAMTPAFSVKASSDQTGIADNSITLAQLNSEDYDTDSAFNTSTYKFTVPSGKAGKYYFYYASGMSGNPDDGEKVSVRLYKNGSGVSRSVVISYVSAANQTTEVGRSYILDLAEGDYVSVYMNHNEGSSNSDAVVSFGGCKIGA